MRHIKILVMVLSIGLILPVPSHAAKDKVLDLMNRCLIDGHTTSSADGKMATCCLLSVDPPQCVSCIESSRGQRCTMDAESSHAKPGKVFDRFGRKKKTGREITTR